MNGVQAPQSVRALAARPRASDRLGSLRRFFTLVAIANASVIMAVVVARAIVPPDALIPSLVAVIVLDAAWASAYAWRRYGPIEEFAVLAGLGVLALSFVSSRSPEPLVGILFGATCISSMYGSLPRVLLRAAVFAGVAVVPAAVGQVDPVIAGYVATALVAEACIAHVLSTFMGRLEESSRREQVLAATGLALVGAANFPSIVQSAVDGALTLCSSLREPRVWLAMFEPPPSGQTSPLGAEARAGRGGTQRDGAGQPPPAALKIVAAGGDDREAYEGRFLDLALMPAFVRSLDGQRALSLGGADAEKLLDAGLPVHGRALLLSAIRVDGLTRGFLGVEDMAPISGEVASTIRTLVTQLALAFSRFDLQQGLVEQRASERFRALVQNSTDVIVIADTDGYARFISPSVRSVFGYDTDGMVGGLISDVVHPDDVATMKETFELCVADVGLSSVFECRIRHADGNWRYTETRVTNLLDEPAVRGLVLNTRDVTERRTLEDELRHQAFHDGLTGLANRALFVDRVQNAVERSRRDGTTTIAVLFIDLEGFKRVNDSFGYAMGDAALQACGERLRSCVRSPDTVARLGADEFAVLLDALTSPSDATLAVDRILGVLRQPLALSGASVELQPHIGIAVSVAGDETPEELLRNGAVAMHRAKTVDGGYTIFDPEMHAAALRRLEVESQLRTAIEESQLVLHYQPTIDLNTGHLTGVEALVRWQHPMRGLVPPLEFIPLAEETGLIVPLGRWAMREACRQVRKWQQEIPNDQPLTLAVNVSARQLRHPSLVGDVADALDDSGLLPSRLTLELTESVLMTDTSATLNKLFQLKSIGVKLAIDDFGTGYSSFAYLRRFPIDILKIDKSFVDGVATEPTAGALVDAMIRIGKTLRMETVAEGVERIEQAEQLRALKCDIGQGYLFSRPLAGEALTQLLLDRQRERREGGGAASAA